MMFIEFIVSWQDLDLPHANIWIRYYQLSSSFSVIYDDELGNNSYYLSNQGTLKMAKV